MAAVNKDNGGKKANLPSLGLFTEYGFTPEYIDWKQVPDLSLRTCIAVAMQAGVILSFAPAQGGLGVTVRVYKDGKSDQAFAKNPQQVTTVLDLITRKLQSPSEDVFMLWAKAGELKNRPEASELPAD